jgi:hypothetical protein
MPNVTGPMWLNVEELANLWAFLSNADKELNGTTIAESLCLLSQENTSHYRNNLGHEQVPHSIESIMAMGYRFVGTYINGMSVNFESCKAKVEAEAETANA